MSRCRFLIAIGIFFCQIELAIGQATPAGRPSHHILTVPSDTIPDLALAVADPVRPVIYYNPRLMARFGPEISAFVLAHERAHIALGHVRPASVEDGDREDLERLLQRWELDADCVAATTLAWQRPAALVAAIRYFAALGSERIDREHPSGGARADRLTACGRAEAGDLRHSGESPRTRSGGGGTRFR